MESFELIYPIQVVFLIAPHFPTDVPVTYEKLHSILPQHTIRRYFGISHPDPSGNIIYKAAAEILQNDHIIHPDLQTFTIEKGQFVSENIVNHFADSNSIGAAFQRLLKHPKLDPNGYCLEVYKNYTDVDVQCMVGIVE